MLQGHEDGDQSSPEKEIGKKKCGKQVGGGITRRLTVAYIPWHSAQCCYTTT